MNRKPLAKIFASITGLVLMAGAVMFGSSAQAQPDGKAIYEANCVACHKIDADLVGPALKGVTERLDEAYLIKWIRNSQSVINSGDKYANDLYKKWNNVQMPAFDLSDDEIKAVLAHIKAESAAAAAPAASAAAGASTGATAVAAEEKGVLDNKVFLYTVITLGAVILLLLVFIQTRLKGVLDSKVSAGEVDLDKLEDRSVKFKLSPLQRLGLIMGSLAFGFVAFYAYAYNNIGMQQGYAPKQPIAFSHELHAGQHQIACTYCHTGAERGKSATIPSVNVCMNCHNQIKKDAPEIKKIWSAWENKKPIEWIRIHNLPDFAYFNHAQHYKVAGIECQKCHGPIQEMKVVAQHAPLTMGWCIDCHRETKIDANNGYYKAVHAKNPKFKDGVTIGQMGGLECSKCHY